MKLILVLFTFLALHHVLNAQGVSVNTTGAPADASAMMDVQSTTKGVLIPRMTTAQRNAIAVPATGLLVFDNTTGSFWFRSPASWIELTDNFHGLRDADHDTQVQVEQSPDEDIIRFDIGGVEAMVLDESTQGATRLDIGPDLSLIIGRNAGLSSFPGWNTILGHSAGQFNTTGTHNVLIGYRAGEDNAAALRNVFVGTESGANNTGSFNTFAGYRTGYVNTAGHSNTFLGHEAGVQNTDGIRNTFVGYSAGHNNEITDENTFAGHGAGYNNEADRNTFYGYEAGLANRTGLYNTIIGGEAAGTNLSNRDMGNGNTILGYEAAQFANGLTENVLIGYRAGYNMTDGLRNIYIGANSGFNTTITYSNIAIGFYALRQNFTGSRNIAMGDSSLYSTTANDNIALGFKSGMDNTTGHSNTFLGHMSGTNNTIGYQNTFLGIDAGFTNTSGLNNVLLGANAGHNNSTGNANLFSGFNSGYMNANGSENIALGNLAGYNNIQGNLNISIGSGAGRANINGNNNIAIGEDALGTNAGNTDILSGVIAIGQTAGAEMTGFDNIIIGNGSGISMETSGNVLLGNEIITYGSNNTYLGSNTSASFIPTPSYATAIGYGARIAQERSIILGDDTHPATKVGIGTIMPDAMLHINSMGSDVMRLAVGGNSAFRVLGNRDVIVNEKLLINTLSGKAGYEMSVNGEIVCEEVLVEASEAWPDYVFQKDYPLQELKDLRSFLEKNHHLPNIPSAAEVEENGIKIGEMQKRLLEKIEEMTLYILQLESRIHTLEKR